MTPRRADAAVPRPAQAGGATTRATAHRSSWSPIPTTSGTGSEVSPAAVLTVGGRKETLVDYCLVPDIAIVDPMLTLVDAADADRRHRHRRADPRAGGGGLDLRLAVHRRVLRAGRAADLRRAARGVRRPDDLAARTDMANAATLAGLAFSNAFVGTNHALAHAVGARFGIAHGRANGDLPAARAALQRRACRASSCRRPGYSAYVAPEKYAQLGRVVFGGRTEEERATGCSAGSRSCSTRRRTAHASRPASPRRTSRRRCPSSR